MAFGGWLLRFGWGSCARLRRVLLPRCKSATTSRNFLLKCSVCARPFLKAAASGEIEQLRVPIEMNEIQPVFAKDPIPDPIAYLKSVSADGNGRETLAILYTLLTTGYAIENAGTKDEMIVWPYHAAIPLRGLTPGQEVEIYRFLSPARLKEMIAEGKYRYYRAGIGRDGVWHYFVSE